MAGRFPRSPDLASFWDNLQAGSNLIHEIPQDRWDWPADQGDFEADDHHPMVQHIGAMDDIFSFDAGLFGISPREAEAMDPHQRVLLEVVWETLEHAGYAPEQTSGTKIGVFVAMYNTDFLIRSQKVRWDKESQPYLATGNGLLISNRISHEFNWHGPSEIVATACSSALVALHKARQAIRGGDCDMALVGGVSLLLSPERIGILDQLGILSQLGYCAPFDLNSPGEVLGEGVGAVILKPLSHAKRDGDAIYAILKATGTNHHGNVSGSITMPSVQAQRDLMIETYQNAQIDPRTISFIEAHGSGNIGSDKVEILAFQQAFAALAHEQQVVLEKQVCGIGSGNTGFLEAAGGMAQLFKVILSMQHKTLPATRNFNAVDESLNLSESPFYIVDQTKAWDAFRDEDGQILPRRGAINAYGLGGTNAHIVIEECVQSATEESSARFEAEAPQLILLSAQSEAQLKQSAQNLCHHLTGQPQLSYCDLQSIAYTLQVGRAVMEHRVTFIVTDIDTLQNKLSAYLSGAEVIENFTAGHAKREQALTNIFMQDEDLQALINQWVGRRKLDRLARLWVSGVEIEWSLLYPDSTPPRVPLPTYPFARNRYWVTDSDTIPTASGNNGVQKGSSSWLESGPEMLLVEADATKTKQKNLEAYLLRLLSQLLKVPPHQIALDKTLYEYGVDSIIGMQVRRRLEETLDVQITGREMLEHGTIHSLAALLDRKVNHFPQAQQPEALETSPSEPADGPEEHLRQSPLHQFPLSEGQKGLWLLQKLTPEMSAYNVPIALRFQQPLDAERWQQACAHLVTHYPILQTVFYDEDGQLRQVIDPTQPLFFEIEDIGHLPETDLILYLQTRVQEPFDLAIGPLLRVQLFACAEEEYILLLTIHHILVDGTSILPVLRTLLQIYQALAEGKDPNLAADDGTYHDFVTWEQEMLAGEEGCTYRAYWQQQLAGELPILSLPLDKPRPPMQRFRGDTITTQLDPDVTQCLRDLAKTSQVNMASLMLAIYKVLLYRYTGQEDILVGMPTAGRPQRRFEETIGYFINMVVVRSQLDGTIPFTEYLKQLQLIVVDALDHGAYPFPRLVAELNVPPNQTISPLFQVSFAFQNFIQPNSLAAFERQYQETLPFEVVDGIHQVGEFDLDLEIVEVEDTCLLTMKYSPDLFDPSTIERMLGHYTKLATEVVTAPDKAISAHELLLEDEKQKILVEWNAPRGLRQADSLSDRFVPHFRESERGIVITRPDPRKWDAQLADKCIHQLFEAQVERTPEAIAVVFGDEKLTYRELNGRANQLAHHLIAQGVAPKGGAGEQSSQPQHDAPQGADVLVGICVERSIEMAIGLLGILKAGGAYVPLDPVYPQERLAYMLSDADVRVLVTQKSLVNGNIVPINNEQMTVVCLDTGWENISKQSTANPITSVQPDDLAYVIYTSGSTGMPKGVAIAHRNLVNAYRAWEDAYQLRARASSHLQMASFSFDVFSGDFVRALCSGAKLVLCPQELLLIPEQLYELMQDEAIDCAEFVPVVLKNLIRYLEETKQNLHFMRLLVVGSDSWDMQDYRDVHRFCGPETRLINSYGVTEATIDSCYFEGTCIDLDNARPVPIGRPFNGVQIYTLDSYGQPVPTGVAGELHIGGDGVAQGYLNRPELTAEKFITISLDPQANPVRLYKSGDMARWLPDGQIELLGRMDHQIKIRGFRVEPSEVEAVLDRHPAVEEAVMVARTAQNGQLGLVAYIIPMGQRGNGSNAKADAATLRDYLKRQVPEYMVPSAFILLDELPLTPNGKVDRKALAAMPTDDIGHLLKQAEFVEPRTPIETALADIWRQLLHLERVSIHDNFFTVGGDSILSLQLVPRARQVGIHLTPQQIFQHQTLAELSTVVDCEPNLQAATTGQPPVYQPWTLENQALVTGEAPLTPIQQAWDALNLPNPHIYTQSILIEIDSQADSALLRQSLHILLRHHDALRLRYQETSSGWRQTFSPPIDDVLLREVDVTGLSESALQTTVLAEMQRVECTLNLTDGPLMGLALLRRIDGPSKLLWITHHLVVDWVSWRILLADLETVYQQLAHEQPVQLPTKTTSFQQWARWLLERGPSAFADEREYWVSRFEGARPLSQDNPNGAPTWASMRVVSAELTLEETQALLQRAPAAYATQINDLLLTALLQTLGKWTQEKTLLIELESHGREPIDHLDPDDDPVIDLSRTVGWFTAAFPVRLNHRSGDLSDQILSVKEQLGQIPNHGLGYGILHYSRETPELRQVPMPPICFNYLGQFDQPAENQGYTPSNDNEPTSLLRGTGMEGLTAFDALQNMRQSEFIQQNGTAQLWNLFDLELMVVAGQLRVLWLYSENVHDRSTVQQLTDQFMTHLRQLIAHCQMRVGLELTE
ncbi:amino acid adenylation domain-containing protein [Chloroflexi bacterium TSY]|nr:amino acid adenylation domain-containing protein [Chloroflexi bacterium TSY]